MNRTADTLTRPTADISRKMRLEAGQGLTELITSTFERPILVPHEYVRRYEHYMRGLRRTSRTIRQRTRWAERILERWPDPGAPSTTDIVEWLGSLEEQSRKETLKANTLATYFGDTKAFYRWLTVAGLVASNPMASEDLDRPKRRQGQPKYLSPAEVERVLAEAPKYRNMEAFVLLALRAGLRASEVAAFRGENIAEDYIIMTGKGDKEGAVPTNAALWRVAQSYPRRGWWFPSAAHEGHISGTSVTILVGRFFRRPEVDIPQGSIHRCRHTYATRLLRDGADLRQVQELMRHSSSATTDIYTGVSRDDLRAAIDRLGA